MDDFKRQLEQAKLARMQGIRLGQTPPTSSRPPLPPVGQPKNRIEEALGHRPVEAVRPVSSSLSAPTAPRPISDVRAPAAVPVSAPVQNRTQDKSQDREVPTSKGYGKFLKRFFLGLLVLIILGAGAFVGRTYLKVRSTPHAATASDVIAAVGKLVELPAGETPTVATISDLKPLAGEAFFKDAAVGDKVLIFATSSKAILYRPTTNKIIQVSPLNK